MKLYAAALTAALLLGTAGSAGLAQQQSIDENGQTANPQPHSDAQYHHEKKDMKRQLKHNKKADKAQAKADRRASRASRDQQRADTETDKANSEHH
jgi:uncharacterized protein HemX